MSELEKARRIIGRAEVADIEAIVRAVVADTYPDAREAKAPAPTPRVSVSPDLDRATLFVGEEVTCVHIPPGPGSVHRSEISLNFADHDLAARVLAALKAAKAPAPDDGGGAQTKAMVDRLDREISRMDALVATKDARISELERERDEATRLCDQWFATHDAHRVANGALGKANSELFKRAYEAEASAEKAKASIAELRDVLTYKNAPSSVGPTSAIALALKIIDEVLTDPPPPAGDEPDAFECMTEEELLAGLEKAGLTPPAGDEPPVPETVTLEECPPGLFEFNGYLGFKSEYRTQSDYDKRFHPDAYVVASGEFFWGGTSTHAERDKLLVRPVEALAAARSAGIGGSDQIAKIMEAGDG